MQIAMITSFIAGCLAGLGVALLAARGRHEELRKALDEARNRETAADARAENSDARRE